MQFAGANQMGKAWAVVVPASAVSRGPRKIGPWQSQKQTKEALSISKVRPPPAQ